MSRRIDRERTYRERLDEIASNLNKVTQDDVGTVNKLLEQASEKPDVVSALYLNGATIDALDLTPPQKAWMIYLQVKRDHLQQLSLASQIHLTIGETLKAALESSPHEASWLTSDIPISIKAPEAETEVNRNDAYARQLPSSSNWKLGPPSERRSGLFTGQLDNLQVSVTADSLLLSNGQLFAYNGMPTHHLEGLRAALAGFLVDGAHGELKDLRTLGDKSDPSRQKLADKIDAILAKRREWVSAARRLLERGGAGALAKDAINSLAPLV
jgi:hypothetical protein